MAETGTRGTILGMSRLLALFAVAVAATALFASSASASPGGAGPFRHDLSRIDARLRMGIEYAPIDLLEGLSTSENVCRLAAKVEERGDTERADADWSTLSQLVEELDRPAMERVDGALQRADADLIRLRKGFSAGWSDRDKVRELGVGVARTRAGIRRLLAALAKMAGSFDAWSAHQCQTATDAIEAGLARVPAAVARINAGMHVLWDLVP